MQTRTYQLRWTTVGTANAVASLRIVKKGIITGLLFNLTSVAGAAINACNLVELSKQSVSAITQSDTPAAVICRASNAGNINGGSSSMQLFVALATPVDVLDTLYAHQQGNGTALASVENTISVFVAE